MLGPFVHNIDPIFGQIGGVYLWWYGLSYTLGFLGIFFWLRRLRAPLNLNLDEVYRLTIYIATGALLGGRMVEVIFYEWAYYGEHLYHIPAVWLGGMSTHGILIGSILATALYCKRYAMSFWLIADGLAIAAAYIMGVGRLGNFIDGQIAGSITTMPWGVKFPDLEGFRHPVVLYDGIKNLLIIPLLLWIKRYHPPRGVLVAHFILWYGFLRIFVDLFREYRVLLYGLPPGQEFNIIMTIGGITLLILFYARDRATKAQDKTTPSSVNFANAINKPASQHKTKLTIQRLILLILLILPIIIPSDWTQDVPKRYGKRHPGLTYSAIYPPI